jgi:hypothetical protein
MTNLERQMLDLREAFNALPASIEREIGLRAVRHGLRLIDRHLDTAVEAYHRAMRFYRQAEQGATK